MEFLIQPQNLLLSESGQGCFTISTPKVHQFGHSISDESAGAATGELVVSRSTSVATQYQHWQNKHKDEHWQHDEDHSEWFVRRWTAVDRVDTDALT